MGIAIGSHDLKHTIAYLENGYVESAAAEVVNRNRLVGLLVQTIGERRGGGLVDDAQHLETRNSSGVLGGIALAVVEVRGNGDDRLRYGLTELRLCVLFHLLQHHRGHFRRRVSLARHLDVGVAVGVSDQFVRTLVSS